MTAQEAFERGTDAFNAHDIDEFRAVLADDVVFEAPAVRGQGKAACADFYRSWLVAFPDAHVEVRNAQVCGDTLVEEGTFTGTHRGVLPSPTGDIPPTAAPSKWITSKSSAFGTASTPRSTWCLTGWR